MGLCSVPLLVLLELRGRAWREGARAHTQLCFVLALQHSEVMRPVSQHLLLIFFTLFSDHTLVLTLKEHLAPIV